MKRKKGPFDMKLYKHPSGDFEGYWLYDILKYCVANGIAEKFDLWFAGSTGGMVPAKKDGKPCMKFIVFKYDWERFLAGYSNIG